MLALSSKSPHPHVWHLTWEFPPVIDGGLGVACEGLYKGLLMTRSCSVEVFHPSIMERFGDVSGAYLNQDFVLTDIDALLDTIISGQFSRDDSLLGAVLSFSSWLLGRAVNHPPEIVHAHDWHSILAAVALKRKYGVPMILQMHSNQLERVGVFAKRGIHSLEQWGIEHADAIISVSEVSAKSLRNNYCVPPAKLHVVRNAIDPIYSSTYENADELKTLLFVGRFCSQKSPELAVEIFRKLVMKFPSLRLLMVGEGELLEPMRRLVDFYGLQHNVELLGKIAPADMALIYSRADMLILPSIAEPFGMVALEAAQSGLGVILTDSCGAKESLPSASVVKHRDVDTWVRSITQLIESKPLYKELVWCLQKEAASRTWQDAAEEMLAIYAKVRA